MFLTAAAVSGYNFSTNRQWNSNFQVFCHTRFINFSACASCLLNPQTDKHTRHVAASCLAQEHMVSETSCCCSCCCCCCCCCCFFFYHNQIKIQSLFHWDYYTEDNIYSYSSSFIKVNKMKNIQCICKFNDTSVKNFYFCRLIPVQVEVFLQ